MFPRQQQKQIILFHWPLFGAQSHKVEVGFVCGKFVKNGTRSKTPEGAQVT